MWWVLAGFASLPVVGIQPYGSVPASDVVTVRQALESQYQVKVQVLPARPLPGSAYTAPRNRYRAELLLVDLGSRLQGCDKVVGLTGRDISTTAHGVKDWGIFGLGNVGGTACVVSTYRLGRGTVSSSEFRVRLANVARHELGHTFGLPHCPTPGCLMSDARGSVKTVAGKLSPLCGTCRAKLGAVVR